MSLTEMLTPRSQVRGEPTLDGASEDAPVFDGLFRALDSTAGLVSAFRGEPKNVQQANASARQPLEQDATKSNRLLLIIGGGIVLLIAAFALLRR